MSKILFFAAHPDDVELCCGGTVRTLVDQGHEVVITDLTQGEMGTRGTPELRREESSKAADILGIAERLNLEIPDGNIVNSIENQQSIIRVVREARPHICFITSPDDRHPDHNHATKLLIDALFYSGLRKRHSTNASGEPQEAWRPAHILHYMQDRPFEPDLVFDITDTMEVKEQAILAYGSQFNAEGTEEPETYISSNRFFKMIRARARHYGHLIGAEFGEPFQYHGGPIPMNNLDLFEETNPTR